MRAKIEISTIVGHPEHHYRLENSTTSTANNENHRNSECGVALTDNEMESTDSTNRSRPELTTLEMAIHGITQAFIVILFLIVTYFSFSNGAVLFSWHPPLMVGGFFILMTNAILAYSNNYYLTYKLAHSSRVTLHWILQVSALTSILIGFLCIYINKNRNGYEHFTSWHGYFGLLAVIISAGASSGGLLSKYSFQLRKVIKPRYIKAIHALFGVIGYSLGIIAICLGIASPWFVPHVGGFFNWLLIIFTAATGIVIISKPILTLWSRITGSRSN